MEADKGWIKVHRKIQEHWIWSNSEYLKAWICILMEANHEKNAVLIENELIECDRGQSLHSLKSWSKLFGKNWSIHKARTFFDLLENDSMIVREGMRKTSRVTVCNYDSYQITWQTDGRQTAGRRQADGRQTATNKNDKNEKNNTEENNTNVLTKKEKLAAAIAATQIRKECFYKSLIPFTEKYPKDMIRAFFDYWSEFNPSGTKMRFEQQPTWEVAKRLATWANKETIQKKITHPAVEDLSGKHYEKW